MADLFRSCELDTLVNFFAKLGESLGHDAAIFDPCERYWPTYKTILSINKKIKHVSG